jgi:hypothetical protein
MDGHDLGRVSATSMLFFVCEHVKYIVSMDITIHKLTAPSQSKDIPGIILWKHGKKKSGLSYSTTMARAGNVMCESIMFLFKFDMYFYYIYIYTYIHTYIYIYMTISSSHQRTSSVMEMCHQISTNCLCVKVFNCLSFVIVWDDEMGEETQWCHKGKFYK